MSFLRRLVSPLLAAWLGAALLTAAVVTPAAFAVLPSRTLAGALVGRVLPVLFLSGAVTATVAFWGARGIRRYALIRVAAFIWIASMLTAQLVVTPRIQAIRSTVGLGIETLALEDPVRLRFGRLHGISVLLLGLGMLSAFSALAVLSWRTEPKGEA